MKKTGLILGMAVLVLLSGLVFVGCSGDDLESPVLTDFIFLTEENINNRNWVSLSTCNVGDRVGVAVRGNDPDGDTTKLVLVVKFNGATLHTEEQIYENPVGNFTLWWRLGSASPSGTFTAEIYAVDAKGNKSKTRTAQLVVQ